MKFTRQNQTKILVLMSLLIAVEVIVERFLSIRTPILTISIGFIPMAIAGMTLGTYGGAMVGGMSDFIGAMLFPIGAYFPGFTLNAVLMGGVLGFFLHRKKTRLPHIIAACLINNLLISFVLGSLWLYILMGEGSQALLEPRLVKALAMVPIQATVMLLTIQVAEKSGLTRNYQV